VHLAHLPSPDAWREEAQRLGVSFEGEAPVLRSGARSIEARDGVSRVRLSLDVAPALGTDWRLEVDDEAELALLRKTQWIVEVSLPDDAPDRLPTALAVSLAAAGEGVCYHAGLDRSVFGADAAAMMAKLASYAATTGIEMPTASVRALIPELVEVVRASVGTAIDPDALSKFLEKLTAAHSADVESGRFGEPRQAWAGIYSANLHLWLQMQPSTRAFSGSAGWLLLMEELTAVLMRGR
jgi:hypothetical protein